MKTKSLESEIALVEFLGVALYVETMVYVCLDVKEVRKPRTAAFRDKL